jgi:hypothetical protein
MSAETNFAKIPHTPQHNAASIEKRSQAGIFDLNLVIILF